MAERANPQVQIGRERNIPLAFCDSSLEFSKVESCKHLAKRRCIDSWLDAKKYLNDAIKEDNMGDPRNLAGAFYRNAGLYAGVVLQIGSAYGNQNCQ